MELQQLVMFVLKTSIFLTVFGFGLNATSEDLLYVVRRPTLLFRSLVAMFVIMPLVAVLLVDVFEFRRSVEIALVALAISPVPPLLPHRETKAGGSASYALALMAIASLLSIAFVPVAVQVLGKYVGQPFAMPPGAIAKIILEAAIVPLLAGMAVRAVLPAVAERIAGPVSIVAKILLVAGALAILAAALPAVLVLVGDGTLLVMCCFAAIGLAVGHLLGGENKDEKIVLAFSTACRHPAIALAIATANFPEEPRLGVTILLYLLVSALVGALYVAVQRHRLAATRFTALPS